MLNKRSTFILLASCVALLACSKLTNENYSKIKVGMPFNEVATLIGQPTSCDDVMGVKSCRWVEKDRSVTVNFVGDQVILHAAENIR
jgi:hypothetical protein